METPVMSLVFNAHFGIIVFWPKRPSKNYVPFESLPADHLICTDWFYNVQFYVSLKKSMTHKIPSKSLLWCQAAALIAELTLHHTGHILHTSSSCLVNFSPVLARLLTEWLKLGNLLFQLCDPVAVHYMCVCQLSGQRDTEMGCCTCSLGMCNSHSFPWTHASWI